MDIRATHASLPLTSGGVHNSHYLVAWMTNTSVTLDPTDLYPRPANYSHLLSREHIITPAGAAQSAGCAPGKAAVPTCLQRVSPEGRVILPSTGTAIDNFTLTVVYEPLANGAYFLGEMTKFVHASPQRFLRLTEGVGRGPAALVVTVAGTLGGETVELFAVDPQGLVSRAEAVLPVSGDSVDVEL